MHYTDRRDAWDAYRDIWQRITNAYEIPPRRSQRDCQIAVAARLVWERDGVEFLDTTAYAWSGDLVLVEVLDHRIRSNGVWVHKSDVRRRPARER
ncbi:hypothetical protein [Promicromonospora sp. AC04]|uniref:hypothetical protein n=1 Tax=Promicromonospora sp. AC04 TaxID=2135723 RepID=UPI000D39644F|nr:hypothetical protein [Promicromonospora sp. AC04]